MALFNMLETALNLDFTDRQRPLFVRIFAAVVLSGAFVGMLFGLKVFERTLAGF
jgi:hypothetical protein